MIFNPITNTTEGNPPFDTPVLVQFLELRYPIVCELFGVYRTGPQFSCVEPNSGISNLVNLTPVGWYNPDFPAPKLQKLCCPHPHCWNKNHFAIASTIIGRRTYVRVMCCECQALGPPAPNKEQAEKLFGRVE